MVSIYSDRLKDCSMEMRVKGVKYYRNRHGRWYAYHRKTGRRIKAEPGTAAFLAELEEIERGSKTEPPPLAGTLGALIAAYRESPEFAELASRTRADYQSIFDYLKPLATHPLVAIDAAYCAGRKGTQGQPPADTRGAGDGP
jgi:hypothetical protein